MGFRVGRATIIRQKSGALLAASPVLCATGVLPAPLTLGTQQEPSFFVRCTFEQRPVGSLPMTARLCGSCVP